MRRFKVDWETQRLWTPRHPERTAWRPLSRAYNTNVEIVEFQTRKEMMDYVDLWDKQRASGWRSLGGGWKLYKVVV